MFRSAPAAVTPCGRSPWRKRAGLLLFSGPRSGRPLVRCPRAASGVIGPDCARFLFVNWAPKDECRMAMLHAFSAGDFLDSMVSLMTAFLLGTLIGAERQYRQRSGGLRTNVLVAVGAAAFVDIGQHLNGNPGAAQVIAYVVSGVGFLGAGVIMKEGGNVWGLNTAATLWGSAAVGACAGADLAAEAVMLTAFVLAGNTLLRPLVNAINRAPIKESGTEAIYEVRLTVPADRVDAGRELLETLLGEASYPFREI